MAKVSAGLRAYVVCPNPQCGDPVPADSTGHPPQSDSQAECQNCHERFAFRAGSIRTGVLLVDDITGRWETARGIVDG